MFVVVPVALLVAVGVFFWLISSGPVRFQHPEQREPIAHAEVLAATLSGCAQCHENPITTVTCTTCHTIPPPSLSVGGQVVKFPHHSSGGEDVSCNECHTSGGDIRFVLTPPTVDHAYCQTCHELKHS